MINTLILNTPIITLLYVVSHLGCPPPSKRNGFSKTVFFDQCSAFLDDIILDIHDVIITGDLNFYLDIPTQLDVRRFSETLRPRNETTRE